MFLNWRCKALHCRPAHIMGGSRFRHSQTEHHLPTHMSSSKDKLKATKRPRSDTDKRTKRRTKTRLPSVETYVYKIVRSVSPKASISCRAMKVLMDFVTDYEDMVLAEAPTLMKNNKTLSQRDIAAAIRLLCPGEVGKNAIAAGAAAVGASAASQS
jgi:histone H2B